MSTEILFSAHPGRRERLLKRQFQNPLFTQACGELVIEPFDIQDARQQDAQEVDQFVGEFRELVQQVSELPPNADADVILKLKEQLDKCYERSAGLAGEQSELQDMIKQLLAMMMQSMWKAVGNDAQGISKLEMEEQARQAHFTLLAHPFIADLLAPDSVINEQLMLPCLLSESAETVALAIQLFEPEQQQYMLKQSESLIQLLDQQHPKVQQANQRLAEMGRLVAGLSPG